jgi:DNA polymerase-3 subunit alpha
MDFLGLKTLSIIKDALANIKHSKGEALDLDNIPFDDALTYELFSKGNTTGIFQFESDGMKKHLKDLKPNRFEDLIAMNALYRPGPMEYIPSYIRRKHGKEVITYDHVLMEEYLKDTYGITVYQEQVMQLSRSMAGFTRGQADSLRKAMGKKIKAMMDSLREEFIKGCGANGIEEKVAVKVWHDWEAFAEYAFNKSHSTCYAYTSYRMAYLKAHYPAEFMAAVLSRNFSDIKKVTFFIDECHKQCIPVLGPDVNESELRFIVNKKGEIRFGLAAIKGLGEAAVENIVSERNKNGNYVSIFDFLKRVNLRAVNRRSIEALAYAGAFDGFEGTHRAQYFYKDNSEDSTFIEKLVRHITISQSRVNEQQHSLFGDSDDVRIEDPPMPVCEEWTRLEQLKNENDVIGFYMSGHPLDDYKVELNSFCSVTVSKLAEDLKVFKGRDVTFGGMVTAAAHKTTKMGKPFGTMTIEDYHGALNLMFFSEAYLKMRHLMDVGRFLLVRGKIEARYGRDDEVEVKVQNMELLSEILDKLTRNITINLPLNTIDDKMADNINALVVAHPGKCSLRFRIMDAENNFSIEMMTKKYKVSGSEFLKSLMANEIGFKLN